MLDIDKYWYQKKVLLWPLWPCAIFYAVITSLRRKLYALNILPSKKFSVPIVIVGNITVGGTGKTPLVIHIVELLKKHGWRPGIVSAGYKGNHQAPEMVDKTSDPKKVGDEALVLARHLSCPIVVGRNRSQAVQKLLDNTQTDIVVSDDGLQHYALKRDIEIAVIDGVRRLGNGCYLPVGPLREPKKRLQEVDLLINNGGKRREGEHKMEYTADKIYQAKDVAQQQLLETLRGKTVHAVAGTGHPARFFQLLSDKGLQVIPHPYPDHHQFRPDDIYFEDNLPVFMTEKDVVKCASFVTDRHWVLPIQATVDPSFDHKLLTLIKGLKNG